MLNSIALHEAIIGGNGVGPGGTLAAEKEVPCLPVLKEIVQTMVTVLVLVVIRHRIVKGPGDGRSTVRHGLTWILDGHGTFEGVDEPSELGKEVSCVAICAVCDFASAKRASGRVQRVRIWGVVR